MLHALIASLALTTIGPSPMPHPTPIEPRKTISETNTWGSGQVMIRYFDAELNVVCYVTSSGYHQTRLACVKL